MHNEEEVLNPFTSLTPISTSKALEIVGNGHRYQTRFIVIFAMQFAFVSILISGFPFFLMPISQCAQDLKEIPLNQTSPICNQTLFCSKTPEERQILLVNYEVRSLTKEYGLFCENASYTDTVYTVLIFSLAAGSFIYGQIHERRGRVYVLNKSISLLILTCLLVIFSWNLWTFLLGVVFMGVSVAGFINASFIYISEISSENLRPMAPSIFLFAFAFGEIILAGLAYMLQGWRPIIIVFVGLPQFITILSYKNLTESPRYLVVKSKYRDAKDSLLNIGTFNQKKVPEFQLEDEVKFNEMHSNIAKILHMQDDEMASKNKDHDFLVIFRYKSIRIRTVVLSYIFAVFVASIVINDLVFSNYAQNFYLNMASNGVIDLVGFLCGGYLLLNYERKKVIKGVLLTPAICFLFFLFFDDRNILEQSAPSRFSIIFLLSLSKVSLRAGLVTWFVYFAEVYPTIIRHFAYSFLTAIGVISVWLGDRGASWLHANSSLSPLFICGILLLIAMIAKDKLRETISKGIEDNITEEEDALLANRYFA